LILASPLYWCGVTGLMKTFLDRLFFYYHPRNKDLISGKKDNYCYAYESKECGF
jgi:multimeric flavodoxin WrbA